MGDSKPDFVCGEVIVARAYYKWEGNKYNRKELPISFKVDKSIVDEDSREWFYYDRGEGYKVRESDVVV